MKNLNEMTVKELKEIAKDMHISNWWNLKKSVLIEKIEAAQALSEEEKQAIADQKAKEDAAIAEYTKNWNKYTKRYNITEFLEKWKSGEIVLESEAQEEHEVEEIQEEEKPAEQPVIEEKVEEKPEKKSKKKSVEEVEPFVYTDTDGEEYEDYDIGEMISKWSEEKKAAFTKWFNEVFICNGGFETHGENELKNWSTVWDAEHPAKSEENKDEKIAKKNIENAYNWIVGGYENSVVDGEMTQEEFNEWINNKAFDEVFSEAMDTGYGLESAGGKAPAAMKRVRKSICKEYLLSLFKADGHEITVEIKDTEGHAPTPKRGALIEYDGRAQNICAWGKELGISPNTLYGRIYKMGWSVEKAFTTKPR